MKKLAVLFTVVVAAILSLVGLSGSPADAAPKVAVGGGTGILVLKGGNSAAACTVTTVGRPTSGRFKGELIGITAGHCGTPGQIVLAERAQNRGPIGKIAYSASDLDIAIIRFNSNVRPVRTVRGVTIKRISTAPVSFPTVVCKDGRTTGHTCGITWFSDGYSHFSQMCVIEGDSGSPVVVGDTLVGMVNAYYFVSCVGPETGTNMGPILKRLNSLGFGGFKPA
ncbi:MAG: serine protease [Gordonia sp. (in: high G+C Gram-positive bacteria)]